MWGDARDVLSALCMVFFAVFVIVVGSVDIYRKYKFKCVDKCSICHKKYDKHSVSFCSNAFHCCRDCVWRRGVVVRKCEDCD